MIRRSSPETGISRPFSGLPPRTYAQRQQYYRRAASISTFIAVMKSGQNDMVDITIPRHPKKKNMKLMIYDTLPLSPSWLAISTVVLTGLRVALV